MSGLTKVIITLGDPSGIGPEITLKAVSSLKGKADFLIIGSRRLLNKISTKSFFSNAVGIIDLDNINPKSFKFGQIRPEYGRAAVEYLDKAVLMLKRKEADCLVTGPISKEAINLAGYDYSGHTEYLSRKTGAKNVVMMLLNKKLKISLVTRHIPLKNVSLELTKEKLYKTIYLSYDSLKNMFRIKKPRLVICGINPHASDNGIIGGEENRVIKPVIAQFKKKGIILAGPISADVAILKADQGEFDGVIAIYHDQALIPLKLSDHSSGVNMTLGLPFIRTSCLHGTGFDIAGKGIASPASLIEAIRLAIKCTLNLKRA